VSTSDPNDAALVLRLLHSPKEGPLVELSAAMLDADPGCWGSWLARIAEHLAEASAGRRGGSARQVLAKIQRGFGAELALSLNGPGRPN
jgi:hypothetical protein